MLMILKLKTKNLKQVIMLPVLSGILLVACQPPVSLFPLAYVALAPLLLSLGGRGNGGNFLRGFTAGIVAYCGLLYWVVAAMNRYGGLDIWTSTSIMLLLVLYVSSYTGVFTLLVPLLERRLNVPFYISAPPLWVLLEYVRGLLITGFPWSFLAHSQHNFLPLIQAASVAGTFYISFLIVAVNSILFFVLKAFFFKGDRARKPTMRNPLFIAFTSFIFLLIALSLVYGVARLSGKEEANLKALIVQGNICQDVKWDEAFKVNTLKKYSEMTVLSGHGADLVLWPETAMPFVFDEEPAAKRSIGAVAHRINSDLLFGTVSRGPSGKFLNSVYACGKEGLPRGKYSKAHLVPFGEYTPLASYLPFLRNLTAAGGDFVPGDSHKPIRATVGAVGVLICYEGAFPSITADTVREGAQVLVNVTNEAWFGMTSAPYQHLSFYVFRAIETDRYILRAANTGISAIIDPRGRIMGRTGLFTDESLEGFFSLREGRTAYVEYGDYIVLLSLLLLAGASLAGAFTRRREI